jgi:predicted RecB family nuclease
VRHFVENMEFTARPGVRVNRVDVRAIIEAGLALRALKRTNQGVPLSDIISELADAYDGWAAVFIETILDYAERDRRLARRFRRWRRQKAAQAATEESKHAD